MLTTTEIRFARAQVRQLAVAAADRALRDIAEKAQRGPGRDAETLAALDTLAEQLAAPVLAVLQKVEAAA